MQDSWLVQRLNKPHAPLGQIKDNPFNFGGGLQNGGLRSEAMDLLRGIFSFDYMGAAEFEWGAVPKALNEIANADSLKAYEFGIPFTKVEKSWRSEDEHPTGTASIYVLCPGEWGDEVQDRITAWAAKDGDYESGVRLKERTRLAASLRGDEFAGTCGWLELDNGFLFFTDRQMWEQTCALFGIDVDEAAIA